MKSLPLSPNQPWLINMRHKESLQVLSCIALGSTPARSKYHLFHAIPPSFRDDWEFVDIMRIYQTTFCSVVQCAFPTEYNQFINIPRL